MASEVVASAKIPDGETIVAVEYPNPLEVKRHVPITPCESPPVLATHRTSLTGVYALTAGR
jgi:hypothetical protein